jgi:putative ABC transport system substrate-binding protein
MGMHPRASGLSPIDVGLEGHIRPFLGAQAREPRSAIAHSEAARINPRSHHAAASAADFETAFSAMSKQGAQAALVLSTPLFINGAKPLAELGLTHKLPSLYVPKQHVQAGGLLSYSPDRSDLWRRGAGYVDRVLKGAKPADLAVQQPTKFELVINLKTARAIGINLPQAFLARADEVIE